MVRLLLFFFLCIIQQYVIAQNRYTISGYIRDEKTGEALIGVSIAVKEKPGTGIISNAYGFYAITLNEGTYTLQTTFMGYTTQTLPVTITGNRKLNIKLAAASRQLSEVVVAAGNEESKIRRTTMGIEKVSLKEVARLPVIMGERDVLKTIQLLPGVKSGMEGTAGFYVRGGAADQNLILLDEAPVYNASHMLGFFSVFNVDAIKDVTLYKGNMPAEYGGRLSSVLDIKMKEGNDQQLGIEGGIGLIASRLSVQGPIVKDKGSFIVSGRRTYADLFLKLSGDETLKDSKLYFYDLNAKANYRLDDNNTLFLSGYFGRDRFAMADMFDIDWGNATATARWNHTFSSRLFSNTSLIYSNYNYEISKKEGGNRESTTSRIQDFNLKQDFTYYPLNNQTIRFGLNAIYHTVYPGTLTTENGVQAQQLRLKRYAWEFAAYFSHELKFGDRLGINYGLRLNAFSIAGPGDFLQNNDTLGYDSRKIIKTYFNPEPRLFITYNLTPNSSLKAAYSRATQNMHLISSLNVAQPTDLWIPSSLMVKPEISDQFSLGYFRNLRNNTYELSIEAYYKLLQNQIDYKDGAQLELNSSVEPELIFGKGRAYGAEFLLRKKQGRLTGWIGYTLARTERQFPTVNKGTWFPARQDRTHDITIVAMYELNKKWSLSADWTYYTGNAVTFPSGKYGVNGNVMSYYTERNGYRMPPYHRLDLGATWQRKKTARFESSWTFSIYNAYARQNPFLINFRKSKTDPNRTEAVQLSLFSLVPSISYNFKF